MMSDFLLVHDVGQGSWCWGRVWGHLTAPVEHPPRLYAEGSVGKVVAMDLPGHGRRAGESGSRLSLDDFVSAVTAEVGSRDLHNLVMAGHALAAPILLQAAAQLEEPPKRVILFAGIIPDEGKSALDMLPRSSRLVLKMMGKLNGMARKDLKLPKAVITHLYCNDMDPFDVIQIIGRFTRLPFELFKAKVYLDGLSRSCPVTDVLLWRDRVLPSGLQRRMAQRLGSVEIAGELDSCHEVMVERPKQVADILRKYA